MADQARAAGAEAAAEIETDLRQLRGLARAGFAADDDNLMTGDRARDFVALARHRQAFGVRDRRDRVRCDDRARRTLAARRALARRSGRILRGRLARVARCVAARRVCRFARLLFLRPARRLALLLACIGRTIRVPGRRRFGPRRRGTFRYIRHGAHYNPAHEFPNRPPSRPDRRHDAAGCRRLDRQSRAVRRLDAPVAPYIHKFRNSTFVGGLAARWCSRGC